MPKEKKIKVGELGNPGKFQATDQGNYEGDLLRLKFEIMKWNVERTEVANVTLIERATNLIGFSIVELGLLANLASSKNLAVKDEKWPLFASIGLIMLSIAFLAFSLDIKNLGKPYRNKDFAKMNSAEIIKKLYKSEACKNSEESLQNKENKFRALRVRWGLWILLISFLPTLWAVLKILTSSNQ